MHPAGLKMVPSAQVVRAQPAQQAWAVVCMFTARAVPKCKLNCLLGICTDTSKRLSRAGIAGVCIGAILCAALAAVLGLLLWRRQLRRQRHCSLGSNSNELVGRFHKGTSFHAAECAKLPGSIACC